MVGLGISDPSTVWHTLNSGESPEFTTASDCMISSKSGAFFLLRFAEDGMEEVAKTNFPEWGWISGKKEKNILKQT